MKLIKITPYNIHLIAFRLKQFFSRFDCVESQTDWGWYPKLLNQMGIPKFTTEGHKEGKMFHEAVEKTMKSYYRTSIINIEVDSSFNEEPFIRVTYSKAAGELFYIGDWIAISPTMIKTKQTKKSSVKSIMAKSEPTGIGYFKPSQNINKADSQRESDEYWDEQYWKDVEKEYENDLMEL